ncbi:hypothetical protein [Nocardia sp. CC227C]|uniref:hypothetical protein n=1 Tax=Nocardia sp. CC227C TaxID=3044562 RepID=UPI00278BC58D|nr:hypothetical protein [Nocardia sp. CC227C]
MTDWVDDLPGEAPTLAEPVRQPRRFVRVDEKVCDECGTQVADPRKHEAFHQTLDSFATDVHEVLDTIVKATSQRARFRTAAADSTAATWQAPPER